MAMGLLQRYSYFEKRNWNYYILFKGSYRIFAMNHVFSWKMNEFVQKGSMERRYPMKFLTFEFHGKEQVGVMSQDGARVLAVSEVLQHDHYTNMNELIEQITPAELAIFFDMSQCGKGEGISVSEIAFRAPIIRPKHDIICVGVNYASHRAETTGTLSASLATQEVPVYFSKRTTRIVGHEEEIYGFTDLDEELDYEVELAVVIGKKGRNISREQVEDFIFGYSIFNDISSRRLQRGHLQWFKGKSLDTYSVMGPVIVHKSVFAYPPSVVVESRVNGEVRQHSTTDLLIHDVAKIISDFSQGITLEPGDIIATGTPSGVGMGFKPPRFMKKGDVVECEIAGIGVLRNTIV